MTKFQVFLSFFINLIEFFHVLHYKFIKSPCKPHTITGQTNMIRNHYLSSYWKYFYYFLEDKNTRRMTTKTTEVVSWHSNYTTRNENNLQRVYGFEKSIRIQTTLKKFTNETNVEWEENYCRQLCEYSMNFFENWWFFNFNGF